VLAVGGVIATQISSQNQRNEFIKAENAKLDVQIKEVSTLKQEIEAPEGAPASGGRLAGRSQSAGIPDG